MNTPTGSRLLKFSTNSPFIQTDYSLKIFTNIDHSNGFIWNTMLKAFVQHNRAKDAIFLYKSMLKNGFLFKDNYTYPTLIQGCSLRLSEFEGKEVHNHVVKLGLDSDVYVVNNLIKMYGVCGKVSDARTVFDESPVLDLISWNSMIVLLGRSAMLSEARQLFDEMEEKDVVSWTAMISCYGQNSMYGEAFDTFSTMCRNGILVDEVVFVSMLSACSHLLSIRMGESVHSLVMKVGFESYVNLQNALIHMYSRWGNVSAAQKLFNAGSYLDMIS